MAVNHALSSTDGIVIIAGKAGVGKTTLMNEVKSGIEEAGKKIFAFAPSADASRGVQRKEGFKDAETIAKLLLDSQLQQRLKNGVIWIDEAGMVSNRDMNKILTIAGEQNARIILSGDTRQHTSVQRGDALRILQTHAGIVPANVSKIQRQKNENYKTAVFSLSSGDVSKGIALLDKMGAIHEISEGQQRIEAVATDYLKSSQRQEVLVISPTHLEGESITEAIRAKLKGASGLITDEREFQSFRNLQYTAAEKKKVENYHPGHFLIFHQNAAGIRSGARLQVRGTEGTKILLQDGQGKQFGVGLDKSDAFNVFAARPIMVGKGDKIRNTGRGKTLEGAELFNGTQYQVTGFDKSGNIKLSNGSTLPKNHGCFTHGYVSTSHSSQGKTVDKIIVVQSQASFRAASMEQFYVSVSRGKKAVAVYTDDKTDLLHAVSQSGERKAAVELFGSSTGRITNLNRQGVIARMRQAYNTVKDKIANHGRNR